MTDKKIMFTKLTGQQRDIYRSHISGLFVQSTFRGKTTLATGPRHLVAGTRDGRRIAFLLKKTGDWRRTSLLHGLIAHKRSPDDVESVSPHAPQPRRRRKLEGL